MTIGTVASPGDPAAPELPAPAGRRIAFVAGRGPKSAVCLMDADGGGFRKIVN